MISTIFGFFLAAAYVPWIAGAASTPRWIVVVCGAAALCCVSRVIDRISIAHVLGCLFLLWAFLNRSSAPEAWDVTWKLAAVAVLFLAGTGLDSLRGVLVGAAAGVALSSVVVVADLVGLIEYEQSSRPSGLFVNGLYLAEFAAIVVAGLLAYREWAWAAMCAPSIVLVNSVPRGPVVALAVAGIMWTWARSRERALVLILLCAVVVPGLIYIRPDTVTERVSTWAEMGSHLSWLGHGLGSYFGDAPFLHQKLTRNLHANNDMLEIAYELGVIGVVLAIAFLWVLLWPQVPTIRTEVAARMMVVVFVVEACFGFPFHLPWSVGLFALAAGRLARYGGGRFLEPVHGGMVLRDGAALKSPGREVQSPR